jgi:hypothetical protein
MEKLATNLQYPSPQHRIALIFMTPTHKYSNGRPVMAGDLCLADLDDSATSESGGRPAAGRVTRLLDDSRIEIAIAPNGYPVIASTSRALSLEDIDAREYKPIILPPKEAPAPTDPPSEVDMARQAAMDKLILKALVDTGADEAPAPAPQEDPAPAATPEPATIIDPATGAPPAVV